MDALKALVAAKRKATEEEFKGKKFLKRSEIEEQRLKKLREEEEKERLQKVRVLMCSELFLLPGATLTFSQPNFCATLSFRRQKRSKTARLLKQLILSDLPVELLEKRGQTHKFNTQTSPPSL